MINLTLMRTDTIKTLNLPKIKRPRKKEEFFCEKFLWKSKKLKALLFERGFDMLKSSLANKPLINCFGNLCLLKRMSAEILWCINHSRFFQLKTSIQSLFESILSFFIQTYQSCSHLSLRLQVLPPLFGVS